MAQENKMSREEAGKKGGQATTMIKNSIRKLVKKAEKPQAKIMTKNSIRKSAKKAETAEAAINPNIQADIMKPKNDPDHIRIVFFVILQRNT